MRVVAADKKIVGSVACRSPVQLRRGDLAQMMPLCRCILMHFSRPFSVLYTVHIHAVS